MNFNRQRKMEKILLHAARAYHDSLEEYIKYPVELAVNGLRTGDCNRYGTHAASALLLPGKAKISDKPQNKIADATGADPRTIKRHFDWLLSRNWMGKDDKNGWLFFRGLDRIHDIEDLTFARAAILKTKDLKNFKAFAVGALCASLAKTRRRQPPEHNSTMRSNRSEPSAAPISRSVIADTLDVSISTAYRLRKLAHDAGYIENNSCLIEITNLKPNDLKQLKANSLQHVDVKLKNDNSLNVSTNRIRYKKNRLHLQMPNMVKPLVRLKDRKGLSKYRPSNGSTYGIQVCHQPKRLIKRL